MGFLDRMIKKGIGDAISSTVNNAVKKALNVDDTPSQASKFCPNCRRPVSSSVRFCTSCGTDVSAVPSSAATSSAPIVQTRISDPVSYFAGILASDFSDYAIQKQVSAASLGLSDAQPCKPYDFCLYKNGALAAAIMLTPHNRDNNRAFLNAKAACRDSGVPFINFYTHFPNEKSYVVSRIRGLI